MIRPEAGTFRKGLEIQDLRLEQDLFQQLLDADALLGRHLGKEDVAPPLFRDHAGLGQFPFYPFRVGIGFVDLVDGHHQGHSRGLGVVDGLGGLFHDAVVRRHHQHHQVRDLGAPGPHGGKGLMARSVQKDHFSLLFGQLHIVGADMLGDAAGFPFGDPGLANRVQKRSFAVVHVAHDGDHRGPRLGLPFLAGAHRQQVFFLHAGVFHFIPEFPGHDGGGIEIDGVIDVGDHPHLQELLDDCAGLDAHAFGQLAHGDGFSHLDPPFDGLGDRELALGELFDGLFHAFPAA